ncbi:MAG: spermidine/putrescine ABC transporter substrate-binding protein [Gammaproteobacteria bacterium]|nr:spermidine/putrescine ABC transporter substrate-binding protein [Gammaproteobacteria bacterium]
MLRFIHIYSLALSLIILGVANASEKTHLSILTWAEYIDPQVVNAFSDKFNTKIDFTYFETDETRDEYLIRTNGAGYDLILVNNYALDIYKQRDWLLPLKTDDIPNISNIDPKWLPELNQTIYATPYTWGTIGIAYRSDLFEKHPQTWMDIFKPQAELSGKILMIGHSRDLIGMAAKALGYSINTSNNNELQEISELLLEQKTHVKSYSYLSINEKSSLLNGDIWAAQIYNGDAAVLQKINPAVKYLLPIEGSSLWIDSWAVTKKSNQPELAYKFLNFINQADHAAKNAEYTAYATPNKAATKLLPKSYLVNPIIYPHDEVLKKCEYNKLLPPRVQRKWNMIYNEITN